MSQCLCGVAALDQMISYVRLLYLIRINGAPPFIPDIGRCFRIPIRNSRSFQPNFSAQTSLQPPIVRPRLASATRTSGIFSLLLWLVFKLGLEPLEPNVHASAAQLCPSTYRGVPERPQCPLRCLFWRASSSMTCNIFSRRRVPVYLVVWNATVLQHANLRIFSNVIIYFPHMSTSTCYQGLKLKR